MNTGSDIYTKLKDDHQAASSILQQLAQTTTTETRKRQSLFAELQHSLKRHSEAEEATFYAVLRQHEQTRDLIRDAQQEHQRIETLLHELEHMGTNDLRWGATLQTLKNLVEHHVHEEEEKVFARARTILPAWQAEDLGQQFAQAKTRQTVAQAQATAEAYAPQATAKARETGDYIRHKAQDLTDEAKAKGSSMLRDQQHFFAAQIGSLAEALHQTAQHLGTQEQGGLAHYTDQAAAGLERFSHSLRDRDLRGFIDQVEDFARRQPIAFVGGAALLGFLASRFLKSSAERSHASYDSAQTAGMADRPRTGTAAGFPAEEDVGVGVPSIDRQAATTTYGGQ
jgi:hemerythrin-like domain-containing protein